MAASITVTPIYADVEAVSAEGWAEWIGLLLGVPLGIMSFGPKSGHKVDRLVSAH